MTCLLAALAALLLAQPTGGIAAASNEADTCYVTGSDDWVARVECAPGYATAHDVVLVFGPRVSAELGSRWAPEMRAETWVLHYGLTGRPILIVRFKRSPDGRALAELFDDVDGDEAVSYSVLDGEVRGEEAAGRPTLQVSAADGWWVNDGKVNFNLELRADGPLTGMIDSIIYLELLRNDGKVDLVVNVRDENHDGLPELDWRQSYPPLDDLDGYYHTSVMVSPQDDQPALAKGPLPWPHLAAIGHGLVNPYFQSPPAVQVDWLRARLTTIGEFVASRGQPNNYFIYSIQRLDQDHLRTANFEAPFAFYNFGQVDEYPDIAVRHVYFGGDDPYSPTAGAGVPTQQVDLSWRHLGLADASGPYWDFKLSLAGRHAVETVQSVGPFRLNLLRYEGLLPWIVEREWDFATFEALEGPGSASTEGLYDWYPLEGAEPEAREYLVGARTAPPTAAFQTIDRGFRTEASFELGARPWLYLSAVDRRLHLKHAAYGIWQVDESTRIRYHNVGGGPYLDSWTLEANGAVRQTLWTVGNTLLHASGQVLRIKALDSPALLERPPPDSPDTMTALAAVAAHAPARGTQWDLAALFESLSGEPAEIIGATVADLRSVDGELRFTLLLHPAFTTAGESDLVHRVGELPPGAYLVRRQEGQFRLAALTPAALELARPELLGSHPRALSPIELKVEVTNAGLAPADRLPVFLELVSGDRVERLGPSLLDLPGARAATARFTWGSAVAGEWLARASVEGLEPGPPLELRVAAPPATSPANILAVQQLPPLLQASAGVHLVIIALLVAGIAFAVTRDPTRA